MHRREFVKITAGAAGAVALGAGNNLSAQGARTTVFIAGQTDTAAALKAALSATGDLSFVKPGDSVLIKPAVNSGNPWPATSSPELINLLVKTLRDRGAGEVIVGDRSGPYRNTQKCMKSCGILDAAKSAGAKVVFFENERYVELKPENAKFWHGGVMSMPEIARDVHRVISLPTVRTHAIAGFTMTIKNWVGLVPMGMRPAMHKPGGFMERLGELMLMRKPDLALLDGRHAFIEGGPDSGTLVRPGLFAAGTDPVALDALGLAILAKFGSGKRISGVSPWKQTTIARAVEAGVGVRSGADIDVKTDNVKEISDLLRFMEVPG